ncbi:MAG: hypothetical protein IJV83_04985 [Clostridia bacterium]|nr:hypothetical protein [Clostridia bacterium]
MKRKFATIYSLILTLLLLAGLVCVFFLAWDRILDLVWCVAGMALSFVLAPIIHELGHVFAAKRAGMEFVFVKCFCFKFVREQGKARIRFASPFSPDVTQVMPKYAGNMQNRAAKYTIGGLIFSGVFLLLILMGGIFFSCFDKPIWAFWGAIPYSAYLFLLNVIPLEYAGGKTDALVYYGIKKEQPAEKTMLAAMEIQGGLYEGKSFSEIEERLYYDVPILPEDEPLYAVMMDLRYRYHLEKGEMERASDCLNRLAVSQAYLSDAEIKQIAVELAYMHAINGDLANAEASAQICKDVLQEDSAKSIRALLAYSIAVGNAEGVALLKEKGLAAIEREYPRGVAKSERIIFSRLIEE